MPGCDALSDWPGAINPKAMASALSAWLGERNGSLPRSLAINDVLGRLINCASNAAEPSPP